MCDIGIVGLGKAARGPEIGPVGAPVAGAGKASRIDEGLGEHQAVDRLPASGQASEVRPNTCEARFFTRTPGRIRKRALLAISPMRCHYTVFDQPIQASRLLHFNAADAQPRSASHCPSPSAT